MSHKNVLRMESASVFLDFLMGSNEIAPQIVSYFHRSLQEVKSFGAMLNISKEGLVCKGDVTYRFEGDINEQYQTYIHPIINGKEKFYHAISISMGLNKTSLLLEKGREGDVIYDYCMKEFNLPLLKEWGKPIFNWLQKSEYITTQNVFSKGESSITDTIPIKGRKVSFLSLYIVSIRLTEGILKVCVSELLKDGIIHISKNPQKKLEFKDMDSYFSKYGPSLVKNLDNMLNPLTELDGEAHDFTLKGIRLYPQQLAQVNGEVALLEKQSHVIMNHGMGTGKTVTAAAIVESFYTRKFLRTHNGATLKDAYSTKDNVSYRNIIMAPGHLVNKWAKEIKEQVPYAKVIVLDDFSKLLKIRKKGCKRDGREWYVISKDFGKLTYQSVPTPRRVGVRELMLKRCKKCKEPNIFEGRECRSCGSTEYTLESAGEYKEGMICPYCNRLLLGYYLHPELNMDALLEDKDVLTPASFTRQNTTNSRCYYCDEELWQPHVANIGNYHSSPWHRASHYSNKAHKGKKTVWVHRNYEDDYFKSINEEPLNYIDSIGNRKYSPIMFIKKYLKGFFDFAIFDEAHLYKGGSTGQGHAMHALIKASKKQLALTGTIAGGYANHLFYLLWRLNPQRMVDKGYKFGSELQFVEKYGKVEREYEYKGTRNDGNYNVCCKGKQLSQPKVKPGISPLIFMDFLLDSTTFLDLSDMSSHLPPLKEKVVTVDAENELEQEMLSGYNADIRTLIQFIKSKEGGKSILGTMLQYSLSYADKPYGAPPIKSPKSGSVLVVPNEYEVFGTETLLSKEKKLCSLIKEEIAEGRNCFVFAEYTASAATCITQRLKYVIETFCDLHGKVAILESTYPKASEREDWMHKKAAEGIKVFISNPRCVETGLDFCFSHNGKHYNYPTIIFYQMGYSLFTIWQASRRAYRLNQTKECRTYYMALGNTIQTKVIELIAEKQAATAAIQGKFSTEGLAAMSNGTDARMKLAQSLCEMDVSTKNNLQEMFDVLSVDDGNDETYSKYQKMLLFSELVGEDVVKKSERPHFSKGAFEMFSLFDNSGLHTKKETIEQKVVEEVNIIPILSGMNSKKQLEGQLSLFSFEQ